MANDKFFMIAWVCSGNNPIGVRLFNSKTKYKKDVSLQALRNVMMQNPNLLENAAYDVNKDQLIGLQGDLRNLAYIDNNTKQPIANGNTALILRLIGDKGAEVCNYSGAVKKFPMPSVMNAIQNGIVTNACIVNTNMGPVVQSLGNPFEVMSLTGSRVGNNQNAMSLGNVVMVGDKRVLTKQLRQEGVLEAEYNDTFGALSPAQRAALVEFFVWHTVDTYSKMSKGGRLEVDKNKLQKLAMLRGAESWSLGGIIDSYLDGRFDAKCSLGHSLRYEFFAVPTDKLIEIRRQNGFNHKMMRKKDLKTAQEKFIEAGAIVFGETCASDFFSIKKEDMQKLVKIRKNMTEEIQLMTNVFTNGEQETYFKKHKLLTEILNCLIQNNMLVDVVGDELSNSVMNFINAGLPMTKSMVIEVCKELNNNKKLLFSVIFKDEMTSINRALEQGDANYAGVKKLLLFVMDSLIEGKYAYDPLRDEERSRKDVGAYNKDTRETRLNVEKVVEGSTGLRLLHKTYVGGKLVFDDIIYDISLSDIKGAIHTNEALMDVYDKIKNIVINTTLYEHKPYNPVGMIRVMEDLTYTRLSREEETKGMCSLLSEIGRVVYPGRVTPRMTRGIAKVLKDNVYSVIADLQSKETMDKLARAAIASIGVSLASRNLYGDYNSECAKILTRYYNGESIDEPKPLVEPEKTVDKAVTDNKEEKKPVEDKKTAEEKKVEQSKASEQDKQASNTNKSSSKNKKDDPLVYDKMKAILDSGRKFEMEEDIGIKITRDILRKCDSWDKMSYKQKWRVNNTLERINSGELK